MENPQFDNPIDLNPNRQIEGEYSPQQKTVHTILHEMFHSMGVGGANCTDGMLHSSDETCLMDNASSNWSRAGHVSEDVREQVLIHNQTGEFSEAQVP